MMDKEVFLTKEGLEKTENEVDQLKSVRRREIAEKIKHALAFGDLSENSEYDEAKNEQAWVEERIGKLENTLRNAVVISDEDISLDSVSVGTKQTQLAQLVNTATAVQFTGTLYYIQVSNAIYVVDTRYPIQANPSALKTGQYEDYLTGAY